MIEHIAKDAVPPIWLGLVGFVLGVFGLFGGRSATKQKEAEQDVAPDR